MSEMIDFEERARQLGITAGARLPGVDDILRKLSPIINTRPELMSLLYDIDMLPEQTVTRVGATRLAGFCAVWERMERAEAALAKITP